MKSYEKIKRKDGKPTTNIGLFKADPHTVTNHASISVNGRLRALLGGLKASDSGDPYWVIFPAATSAFSLLDPYSPLSSQWQPIYINKYTNRNIQIKVHFLLCKYRSSHRPILNSSSDDPYCHSGDNRFQYRSIDMVSIDFFQPIVTSLSFSRKVLSFSKKLQF